MQKTVDSFGVAAFTEGIGFALADNVVDPGLQRGGDAEVVYRAGNHENVGSKDFTDEFLAFLEALDLIGRAACGGSSGGLQERLINHSGRLGGYVALNDLDAASSDGLAQDASHLSRIRPLVFLADLRSERARVNEEDLRH